MFEKRDIHIHVPDGATPKDGPSAGAAMTTAFVSALTGIPVRADVAMTGEITLRGEVTAIGGLKEKLLAAHRGGIKTVMIPEENVKDLQDIPENVKNHLEIVPVRWIDRVLEVALTSAPQPCPMKRWPRSSCRRSRPRCPSPRWGARCGRTEAFRGAAGVAIIRPCAEPLVWRGPRGNSSVGRAQPCQG